VETSSLNSFAGHVYFVCTSPRMFMYVNSSGPLRVVLNYKTYTSSLSSFAEQHVRRCLVFIMFHYNVPNVPQEVP